MERRDASIAVVEDGAYLLWVNGACPVPGGRLAVCHRTEGGQCSVLSLLDDRGAVVRPIPLYRTPLGASRRGDEPVHTSVGEFLLNSWPAGWHEQYGIILCADEQQADWHYAVRPDAEAMPRPLPEHLSRVLATWDSTTTIREQAFGLRDGRTVFVFSTGGIVLGPSLDDLSRIEGGVRARLTLEILGCRADGHVVVCDGYEDPDNAWSLENERLALPPFERTALPVLASGFLRVTRSGAEVSVSDDKQTLEARGKDGVAVRWMAPADERIADATSTDSGRLLVTTMRAGKRPAAFLHLATGEKATKFRPIRLYRGEDEPRIAATGGGLALIERIDPWGHATAKHAIADLRTQKTFRCKGGTTRILALPEDHALLIAAPSIFEFDIGQSCLYSPAADSPWGEIKNLEISPQSLVKNEVRQGSEWLVEVVSVVAREWQWGLSVRTLRFIPREQTLMPNSARDIPLSGEVACWARHGEQLILGYASGCIEIRSLARLGEVIGVGHTASRPNELVVTRRPAGEFIVVSAGELVWFQLPDQAREENSAGSPPPGGIS